MVSIPQTMLQEAWDLNSFMIIPLAILGAEYPLVDAYMSFMDTLIGIQEEIEATYP